VQNFLQILFDIKGDLPLGHCGILTLTFGNDPVEAAFVLHTQKSPILMSCPGRSSEKGHFILFFSILASYLPLRNHILNRTGRSQLGSGLF